MAAELFVRDWEGLRLSEPGRKLLPSIEGILDHLDAMRSAVAGLSKLESGNRRSMRFPGIDASIIEGTDDEVRQWILSGLAHVGFAALPVEGVAEEEIGQDQWLALVPESKFAGKTSVTLQELAAHRFLMSGGGCEPHIQRMFASMDVSVTEHLMVKQMPTIHAMVAEDLGVSLIPALSVSQAQGSKTLPLRPRRDRKIGIAFTAPPARELAKKLPSARSDRAP